MCSSRRSHLHLFSINLYLSSEQKSLESSIAEHVRFSLKTWLKGMLIQGVLNEYAKNYVCLFLFYKSLCIDCCFWHKLPCQEKRNLIAISCIQTYLNLYLVFNLMELRLVFKSFENVISWSSYLTRQRTYRRWILSNLVKFLLK